MKLLKTLLLSTTLVVGTTFGASVETAHQSAPANTQRTEESAAKMFLDSLHKIEEQQVEQANLIALIISFLDHNKRVEVNQVNASDQSVELLGELLNQVQALVAERNGLKTTLEAETASKEKIAQEQTEADRVLEGLKAELEEANKTIAVRAAELTEAKTKVDELTIELEKVKADAEKSTDARTQEVERLEANLKAANVNATALAAEVKRITAENADLTEKLTRAEATSQRLSSTVKLSDEARQRYAAAIAAYQQSDSDDDDNANANDPLFAMPFDNRLGSSALGSTGSVDPLLAVDLSSTGSPTGSQTSSPLVQVNLQERLEVEEDERQRQEAQRKAASIADLEQKVANFKPKGWIDPIPSKGDKKRKAYESKCEGSPEYTKLVSDLNELKGTSGVAGASSSPKGRKS